MNRIFCLNQDLQDLGLAGCVDLNTIMKVKNPANPQIL